MKNKLKNIINLSKLFITENDTNLNIFNFKTKKFNKKSLLFWIYVILFFAMFYISSEIIDYTIKIGKPQIFLNGFLLFLEVLIILRTIMVSMNVFYFSKDMENILHLPFKPIEILISKFNTILFMNFEIELIVAFVPLLIYGISTNMGLLYFINLLLILIIFPIFAILFISIIIIFLMKSIKVFKNKDLMQIIFTILLIAGMIFVVNKSLNYVFNNAEYINENQEMILNNINNSIIEINKHFLSINPSSNILLSKNVFIILLNFVKLFLINAVAFVIFLILGDRLYLRQLLKANFYTKNKKKKIVNLNKKSKKNKIAISYIKKEFKMLLKNPMFFIQSIYPVIITTITFCFLVFVIVGKYNELMQQEEYRQILENLKFDIEAVCIIIGAIQFVGLFNYTSVTAFSREGKEVFVIKYLPISLYKQFIYKNVPQIVVNSVCAGILCFVIKLKIPAISINYMFAIFALSFLMIMINSFILTLVDLIMPKLKWDAEYEILKNNKNKLLQYVLIIVNILFLIYIKKIFNIISLDISLIIFGVILIVLFVVINVFVCKFSNKLYKKII